MRVICFDTETTGLPAQYNAPISAMDNWPRVVQLAFSILDFDGENFKEVGFYDWIIKPFGFAIPAGASRVHGITTEIAMAEGMSLRGTLESFAKALEVDEQTVLVAHNMDFDFPVIAAEFYRLQVANKLHQIPKRCTMKSTTDLVKLPNGRGGFKWPKLKDLHIYLFGKDFEDAHNAASDVGALVRCTIELKKRGIKLNAGNYVGE